MPDRAERRPDHERKKRYRQYQATDSLLIGHSLRAVQNLLFLQLVQSRIFPSGYLALDTTPLGDNPLSSD